MKNNIIRWVSIIVAMLVFSVYSDGNESEPVKQPLFNLHGHLKTSFGLEFTDTAFSQRNEFLLSARKSVSDRISLEVQLLFDYTTTENQLVNSFRDSSLLSMPVHRFLDSTQAAVDSMNVGLNPEDQFYYKDPRTLVSTGQNAYSTRLIPKLSVLLDRANIRYRTDYADIILGKQVIAWGSGYAWNPTDAVNYRNPLTPLAPREGEAALLVESSVKEFLLFTGLIAPGSSYNTSTFGMRLKFTNRFFDFALSGNRIGNSERELMGVNHKLMGGADFSIVLPGEVNFWIEASASKFRSKDTIEAARLLLSDSMYQQMSDTVKMTGKNYRIQQAVVGLQHVFGGNKRVILETYYNSQGIAYPYNDMGKVAENMVLVTINDISGIAKWYGALGLIWEIGEKWELTALAVSNLADKSTGIIPIVVYSPLQNFKVSLKGALFLGEKTKTEFGSFNTSAEGSFQYLF